MKAATQDDRWLVERIVRYGDEGAFSALYDRHTPYLYRLALRLLGGDDAGAADLIHDAWVLAAPRLGSFAWRSTVRTWLSGFVVNQARRSWRDEPTSHHDDSGADTPAFDSMLLARIDLERALAALPPGARQVLVLHDLEGWTHREIAEQLALEVGTSKSQLARGRRLLRTRLTSLDPHGGR